MRVLTIDDNSLWRHALKAMLSVEGFQVFMCESCENAVSLTRVYDFDAIIVGRTALDTTVPKTIGRLRSANVATAILALSDCATVSSRVAALAQGADDCLSKPFHKAELSARLRAIIRRSCAHSQSVIRIEKLEINLETQEVRVSDQPVHMTRTEYRMLELLALRKGKVVHRRTIFELLYDGHDDPEEKVIDVFVHKIRKKIALLNRGVSYIETTWGEGYRLSEPATCAA
jgi:two-component system, cell cycle response regulator CtrA